MATWPAERRAGMARRDRARPEGWTVTTPIQRRRSGRARGLLAGLVLCCAPAAGHAQPGPAVFESVTDLASPAGAGACGSESGVSAFSSAAGP